jgi:hypothetical protein
MNAVVSSGMSEYKRRNKENFRTAPCSIALFNTAIAWKEDSCLRSYLLRTAEIDIWSIRTVLPPNFNFIRFMQANMLQIKIQNV